MNHGRLIRFPTDRGLYFAKSFYAVVGIGRFEISGTICGCVDLAVPGGQTFSMTTDEAFALAQAILASRQDVIDGSRPDTDPRLRAE